MAVLLGICLAEIYVPVALEVVLLDTIFILVAVAVEIFAKRRAENAEKREAEAEATAAENRRRDAEEAEAEMRKAVKPYNWADEPEEVSGTEVSAPTPEVVENILRNLTEKTGLND